mgnify:FL=1
MKFFLRSISLFFRISFIGIILFGQSGCFHLSDDGQTKPILTHIVLCWLKEPGNHSQQQEIIEMTESFRDIPSVLDARAGRTIKSDRSIVDDSFDVGIVVEVRNEVDLKKYLEHPIHQNAKKEVLLPLVDRVLVYDFSK